MRFVAWMIRQNLFAQHLTVDFGVDFGSRYLLMSEHHLDGSQIGSALEQMGGKRMTEGMGRDLLLDARLLTVTLDDIEHHDTRQLPAEAVEEDIILKSALDIELVAEFEVIMYLLQCTLGNRYDALLATLAPNLNETLAFEDVTDAEVSELRDSKPAAVERLEDGSVALPVAGAGVSGGDDAVHLVDGQDGGYVFGQLGRIDALSGVCFEHLLKTQEAVVRTNAREDAVLRSGHDTHIVQTPQKMLDVLLLKTFDAFAQCFGIFLQFGDVSEISIHGVFGEVSLKFKI